MGQDTFVAIDLGGTNLRVYEMFPKEPGEKVLGRNLLGLKDVKMRVVASNLDLSSLVHDALLDNFGDRKLRIGISAAGDVDEQRLVILKSPNLAGIKGEVTLGKDLAALGHDVVEGNDMRCAAAGAVRYGQGKGVKSFMIVTYSSGHNGAKVENGIIVTRAELGHMPYQPRIRIPEWASALQCGCGGLDHLEPYVSSNGAAYMARNYFAQRFSKNYSLLQTALDKFNKKAGEKLKLKDFKKGEKRQEVLATLDARDIYESFREHPDENPQNAIARIQTQAIADSFGIMVSAFNPLELIICMGSQTKDWQETFEPAIGFYQNNPQNYHLSTLHQPRIEKNSVRKLGCVGALSYYLDKRGIAI